MDVVDAFRLLFETLPILQDIDAVVWDVDETLGAAPGWESGPLSRYVHRPADLRRVLRWLKSKGIVSTLVSRNLAFCDGHLVGSSREARALGFDHVHRCSRRMLDRSKADLAAEQLDISPRKMLLIDDNTAECMAACESGAVSLCCRHGPALPSVRIAKFEMYIPTSGGPRRL